MIVFHDAFRINEWASFFKDNNFNHVCLDTHMYQCFDKKLFDKDISVHEKKALDRKKVIDEIQQYVPLIIGEWSLGLRVTQDHLISEKDIFERKFLKM